MLLISRMLARSLARSMFDHLDNWMFVGSLWPSTMLLIARTWARSHFLTWSVDAWRLGRFHARFHTFTLMMLAQMTLIACSNAWPLGYLGAWSLGRLLLRRCSLGYFSYFDVSVTLIAWMPAHFDSWSLGCLAIWELGCSARLFRSQLFFWIWSQSSTRNRNNHGDAKCRAN